MIYVIETNLNTVCLELAKSDDFKNINYAL